MGVRTREKPKDSGVWWVFVSFQGKRTSGRVGNREAAQEVAKQIEARLTLGKDALPARRKRAPTLDAYFERVKKCYLKNAIRPKTQVSYQSSFDLHILPRLGSKRLDEISKADIKNLIAALVETGLAKASIQLIIAKLRAVLNHAMEDELITKNVATKCSKFYAQAPVRHEEIQPLNPEEVGLFLQAAWNRGASRKHFPLFLCAIHTGMRSGELAALQWGDIDENGRFLTLRRSYVSGRIQPTKTGRIRRVDLSDALLQALRDHKKTKRAEWLRRGSSQIPVWVFVNDEGNPPDMCNLGVRHFKKCLDAAGLRTIRFHDLRHTYASLLIQNGEPLAYVRDQLGHASIQMTVDVYGHLEPGRNRQAVNKLPTIKDAPAEALKKASNS